MKPSFRQILIPFFSVLLLGVVTIGYLILTSSNTPSLQQPQNTDENFVATNDPLITKVNSPQPTVPTLGATDRIYGNSAAKVTIVEFSDFACPYCRVMSALLKQAVDANPDVVKIIWRDFPISELHPGVANAHIAGWCAGEQNKFWEYHDELFAAETLNRTTYLTIAQKLKLDPRAFASCLESDAAKTAILDHIREGESLGVDGTPYLFVGDQRISGLLSAEELNQVLQLHKSIAP